MTAIALILIAISLDLKDAPLTDALKHIEQQSGLQLAYEQKVVENAEPVTLKVDGVPAGEVLHRILRPRGLEFIQISRTMVAIVPAESDMGMAKMAGRAIRTFARLAKKLEGAEQHGDEVRVPGWADADDRALAEVLRDYATVDFYRKLKNRPLSPPPRTIEEIERIVAIRDPDVRAAAASVVVRWARARPPEEREPVRTTITDFLNDADPVVRARTVESLSLLMTYLDEEWTAIIKGALERAAKDPEPCVRFAAALASAAVARARLDVPGLDRLREDTDPSVRAYAWAGWLETGPRLEDRDALASFSQSVLAHKNPLLKLFGIITLAMNRNSRGTARELIKSPGLANDAWLNASTDVLFDFFASRQVPLDGVVNLMASGKPSHQAVGIAVFALGAMQDRGRRRGEPATIPPELIALGGLSDSTYLWARLFGVFAKVLAGDAATDAHLANALRSDDEFIRLAALLACNYRGLPMASPEACEAVVASFRSPLPAERALGATAVVRALPLEKSVGVLDEEIRNDPMSLSTRMLIKAFGRRRDFDEGTEEERARRKIMVVDVILRSNNAELQQLFRKETRWLKSSDNALMIRMIKELEPQAFCGLLEGMNYKLYAEEATLRAVLDRLTAISLDEDPAVRHLAARGMGKAMRHARMTRKPEAKADVMKLATAILQTSFGQGATDDEIAAGFVLLDGLVGESGALRVVGMTWADVPDAARKAIVRALGYANDKTHAEEALTLLSGLIFVHAVHGAKLDDPELLRAMESARRAIMKSGRADDQITLLCAQLREPWASDESAFRELEQRLLKHTLSDEQQRKVFQALAKNPVVVKFFSEEFNRYLLKQLVGSDDRARRIHRDVVRMLAHFPDQHNALLDALIGAREEDPNFPICFYLGEFLGTTTSTGKPNQAWCERAAQAALEVIRDPKTAREGHNAVSVYARLRDPYPSKMMETFVLDDKLSTSIRSAAANHLPRDTSVYPALMKKYQDLSYDLRYELAEGAASSPKATGAVEFVIRFLKDEDMKRERRRVIQSVDLPLTPELEAVLQALEKDPQLAQQIQRLIKRLEQKQQKQRERK